MEESDTRQDRVTEKSGRQKSEHILGPIQQLRQLQYESKAYTRTAFQPYPQFQSGTEGHLEAIMGIIYNHSEVTTQKCRLQERQRRWRDGKRESKRESERRAFQDLT